MITLVLGGTRSGKSAVAERLAARTGTAVTYVATGTATDADMAARIEAHRVRRPRTWSTVEAGRELAAALDAAPGPVLVDSLGAWVAAWADADPPIDDLVTALARQRDPIVVVSEEVGMSVHPPTPAGRRFVDRLGEANARVAEVADDVLLVVAGRVLPLPRPEDRPC